MALGALEYKSSNASEEIKCEAMQFIDNADAVFSALGSLIKNGMFYGQNKH